MKGVVIFMPWYNGKIRSFEIYFKPKPSERVLGMTISRILKMKIKHQTQNSKISIRLVGRKKKGLRPTLNVGLWEFVLVIRMNLEIRS